MRSLTFIIFIFYCTFSFSQEEPLELSTLDSLEIVEDTVIHSPKKAMLYSAVIPGAGQIYNHIAMPKRKKKAFWKVPIIYAGLGVTGFFAIKNNKLRLDARNEYRFREKNPGLTNNSFFNPYDNNGVLLIHNQAQTNRDLMIFGAIIVYGLNILDAGVEAHFVNFDISDNLSLNVSPTLFQNQHLGATLSFNFS